jgi:hypothetical protein
MVFLGVAAALAGQSWFEDRADRRMERELLDNVIAEARTNYDTYLDGAPQRYASQSEYFLAFASLLEQDDAGQYADSIAVFTRDLLRSGGTGLVYAALDEALANLRLIEDPAVRLSLSQYRDGIRVILERTDDFQDWVNGPLRSFLIDQGYFRPVTGFAVPAPLRERQAAALAASDVFKTFVYEEAFLYEQLSNTSRSMSAYLPTVLADLEAARAAL